MVTRDDEAKKREQKRRQVDKEHEEQLRKWAQEKQQQGSSNTESAEANANAQQEKYKLLEKEYHDYQEKLLNLFNAKRPGFIQNVAEEDEEKPNLILI